MLNRKIISLIQFAKRSKSIVYKQSLANLIIKNRIYLIILAKDIAPSSLNDIRKICKNVDIIYLENKSTLGELLSKDEVSVFGISNRNIANQIKLLVKEENYGKEKQQE